jgi:iron complex transport system ATP-binding protein
MVLVTHHVEEIPPAFTHVMMLREGRVVAAGPLADSLTETNLAASFDLDVELTENAGRWSVRVR